MSELHRFHTDTYGLAQHWLVKVKGKPERKSQKCNKAPIFNVVTGLRNTFTTLHPVQRQVCHRSHRISLMPATRHESVCGVRDHKPVCPGDFTPTGMRGMGVWEVERSVILCLITVTLLFNQTPGTFVWIWNLILTCNVKRTLETFVMSV